MHSSTLASCNISRTSVLVLAVLMTACLTVACGSTPESEPAPPAPAVSADTWAVVDGREITRDDVEQAYRRAADPAQPLSDEEALTAKLSLLNELIVEDILLAKARELKLEVSTTELDAAYAEARNNIPGDAFEKELARRSLTAADMRESLRRELMSQKVIEQEIGSKIAVTDREVNDFFNANRAQFNIPEEAYHVAQIVVTPVREPQITNRTGDDAATPEAAEAKTKMLLERLNAGAPFEQLATDFSEDPESAPRGGDLGLVPVSRLKQAPPALRDAVLQAKPGTVNVVSGGGGHTIVLVIAHERAGQRDLSMPEVREGITQRLRARKEQLMRAAYLTAVRSDSTVVNHLARRLVESPPGAPNLGLSAPGAP